MMDILLKIKDRLLSCTFVKSLLYKAYFDKYSKLFHKYNNEEDKWLKFQGDLLYNLLRYAKSHSRYYSNLIPDSLNRANCKEILCKLPFLTKDIIREQGFNIFSDELSKKKYGWANTGGSTGEPLRFPAYGSGNGMEFICQMMLYNQMGADVTKDVIVSVDGSRIPQEDVCRNIFWKKELHNFPYGQYCLSTLYMSEATMQYYVNFLNQVKPKVMRGYPSGFSELANYCAKNKVELNFELKGIYMTSENFGSTEEELVSEVFKCPVWGQYGHTESSVFAVKKPRESKYICYPIYGYTEVLNSNGEHVKVGQEGEIVVSGFNHYGMPFIRYKTGDLAEYGGTLENGSLVLNKLLGRSVDYLINCNEEVVYLVGFIFGGHLKAFNHIRKWQLEQFEKGVVTMKICKADGYNESVEKEIIDLFMSKMLSLNIVYTDDFEKTARGKFKFLIQHIN